MSDVIDLGARRRPDPVDEPVGFELVEPRRCGECGGTQFRLLPGRYEDGTTAAGTVTVDEEFSILTWAGSLVCDRCFTEVAIP